MSGDPIYLYLAVFSVWFVIGFIVCSIYNDIHDTTHLHPVTRALFVIVICGPVATVFFLISAIVSFSPILVDNVDKLIKRVF